MAENDLYAPFSATPPPPRGMWDELLASAQTQRNAPQRSGWYPQPPSAPMEGPPTAQQDAAAWAEQQYGKFGQSAAGAAFAEHAPLVPPPGGSGDWKKDALDVANLAMLVMPGGAPLKPQGIRARDPAMWHNISLTKLPRPISEMSYGRLITEAPTAERRISPEALQGGVLLPAVGDRSATGGFVTHSGGGQRLEKPVPLQGGHGFMAENAPSGQIWASDKPIISTMANRAKKISDKEQAPVYVPYTAMSERSVDFSHHVSDILTDQLKTAKVPAKALTAFDDVMRDAAWNGFKPRPDWPGAASKGLDEYLVKAPGAVRNKFAQLMARGDMQKAGFPSVAEARFAVTDPRLLNEPTGAAGLSIGRLDPSSVKPSSHRTYDTGIGGTYEGGFGYSVPKEIIYPDIVAAYQKQGFKPEQIDYLMQKGTPPAYQKADAKWLEGMMKYDEAIRRGE